MNVDKVKILEALENILKSGEYEDGEISDLRWNDTRKIISFRYSSMYDSPPLNFSTMKELSDHFGTDEIDIDGYSQRGCETCDYGSEYGHDVEIMEPTKGLY
jgi:hypothetical protein